MTGNMHARGARKTIRGTRPHGRFAAGDQTPFSVRQRLIHPAC
jgi:hypothetical protein